MTERMQDQIRQWFIEVRCVQRPAGGPMQQDLSTQGRHQPAVTTTSRLHSCVCVCEHPQCVFLTEMPLASSLSSLMWMKVAHLPSSSRERREG